MPDRFCAFWVIETRANCGDPATSLQTEDPERAFLAIDSGFPLPELEQTLQGGKPFEYPFSSSPVPVLFTESDWTKASPKNFKENSRDLLDTILNDPSVARLYWALSRLDPETSQSLQQSIGLASCFPTPRSLIFTGGDSASALAESGFREEPAPKLHGRIWLERARRPLPLLSRNCSPKTRAGWSPILMCFRERVEVGRPILPTPIGYAFFTRDCVPQIPPSPPPEVPSDPHLRCCCSLHDFSWRATVEPLVPGNLDVWKDILLQGHNAGLVRRWGKQTPRLSGPDELVQVMFALSRAPTDVGPLQVYMAISELDSRRSAGHRLAPDDGPLARPQVRGIQ